MEYDLLAQKKDLTAEELSLFNSELHKRQKNTVVLWLLWLFTGAVGGHRYYLGDTKRGLLHSATFLLMLILGLSIAATANDPIEAAIYAPVAMLLFLSVPAIWAIIDAFFIGRRLAYKNAQIEKQLIEQVKKLRSNPT